MESIVCMCNDSVMIASSAICSHVALRSQVGQAVPATTTTTNSRNASMQRQEITTGMFGNSCHKTSTMT